MPDIKISDAAFLAILRANGGLYANTARAIEKEYGITYTRQGVRQRALEHPEELADIDEQVVDLAEEGLQELMRHEDAKIKVDAIKFYLKTRGKKRGYIERTETEHSGKIKTQLQIVRTTTENSNTAQESAEGSE